MMKRFFKRLIILLFILGVGLGILTSFIFDDAPLVKPSAELSQRELTRIEQFIRKNNPQDIKEGKQVKTQISETDLKLLISYILQRLEVNIPKFAERRVGSLVSLQKNKAKIKLSFGLPEYGKDKYINITAEFVTKNEDENFDAGLKKFRIGEIELPAVVVKLLADKIHADLKDRIEEYDSISLAIKNIQIDEQKLTLNYDFDKQVVERIQRNLTSRVFPESLKQALIAQSNQLAFSSQRLEMQPSINVLFKPMFELAQERSQLHDPVIENKAVFIVLGAYVLNKNITQYFDQNNRYIIKAHKLYLQKRHDLSRHFLASAAITSIADSSLAKTIGLQKEIGDSDGGSGFSFIDLAADYAGIKLAKFATANEMQARQIQYYLAAVKQENEYMPETDKLAEGIYRTDLNSGFKSSEQYIEMEALIIDRIQQLAVYKIPGQHGLGEQDPGQQPSGQQPSGQQHPDQQ